MARCAQAAFAKREFEWARPPCRHFSPTEVPGYSGNNIRRRLGCWCSQSRAQIHAPQTAAAACSCPTCAAARSRAWFGVYQRSRSLDDGTTIGHFAPSALWRGTLSNIYGLGCSSVTSPVIQRASVVRRDQARHRRGHALAVGMCRNSLGPWHWSAGQHSVTTTGCWETSRPACP